MNRFVSQIGVVRWAGGAVLGFLSVSVGHATGFEALRDLGLAAFLLSLGVVGVALLVARSPRPEPAALSSRDEIDYWA